MSIKQFQQELAKGLPAPVYLLTSSEGFLLYDALSEIREAFGRDGGFNFDVFDSKSSDDTRPVGQIIDILNTLPFLSGRRVVVIENAQKLSKKDAKGMEAFLANPSPTALLVLLFEGSSQKVFDPAALKAVKAIALNVYEKDIPQWMKAAAAKKGFELTQAAADYLLAFAGTDLGMLHAEIEKFSSWGINPVDVKDIKGMVYAGLEFSAFDLVDAIKKKDTTGAFRIFDNLNRTTDGQMLLGALNWQYANMFRSAGVKADRHFRKVFRLLHEADVGVKTSRLCVMEELLVKLIKLTPTKGY